MLGKILTWSVVIRLLYLTFCDFTSITTKWNLAKEAIYTKQGGFLAGIREFNRQHDRLVQTRRTFDKSQSIYPSTFLKDCESEAASILQSFETDVTKKDLMVLALGKVLKDSKDAYGKVVHDAQRQIALKLMRFRKSQQSLVASGRQSMIATMSYSNLVLIILPILESLSSMNVALRKRNKSAKKSSKNIGNVIEELVQNLQFQIKHQESNRLGKCKMISIQLKKEFEQRCSENYQGIVLATKKISTLLRKLDDEIRKNMERLVRDIYDKYLGDD